KLCLNPPEVLEILCFACFLCKLRVSGNILLRKSFHFFTQIGIKPWRGFYVFFEEIKIVLHCLARLLKTLRHHFTQGKRGVAACHGYLLTISVPSYIIRPQKGTLP